MRQTPGIYPRRLGAANGAAGARCGGVGDERGRLVRRYLVGSTDLEQMALRTTQPDRSIIEARGRLKPLDAELLHEQLRANGFLTLDVHSAAPDRQHYLRRPDLGRRLADDSRETLALEQAAIEPPDVLFVIADGLSAFAASKQAIPLLQAVCPKLADWKIGPVVVARQARVALGDEIGELLGAKLVVMLIGERPGLSSPDSLGVYLTYAPKVGCSDAQRNCISNVRPEGLSYGAAAHKLHYLLTHARRLSLTGVGLKDDSDALLE